MGAAEMGDGGSKDADLKLNAVIVGAADSGPWEPGAEDDGA